MLLVIFILIFLSGFVAIFIEDIVNEKRKKEYDKACEDYYRAMHDSRCFCSEIKFPVKKKRLDFEFYSELSTIAGTIAVGVSIIVLLTSYIGIDAQVCATQEKYDVLSYQVENNFYDNDNEYGKKELMAEVSKWNQEMASGKELQRDFWVGVYVPNVYDQFELIDYSNFK